MEISFKKIKRTTTGWRREANIFDGKIIVQFEEASGIVEAFYRKNDGMEIEIDNTKDLSKWTFSVEKEKRVWTTADIRFLQNTTMSTKELASHFGVSAEAVRKQLSGMKISLRDNRRKQQ